MTGQVFQGIETPIIYYNGENYDEVIKRWAALIKKQHRKGLIPLFITGLGVSKDGEKDIPDLYDIIAELEKRFIDKKYDQSYPEIKDLFGIWRAFHGSDRKDRGTIAKLLKSFQETNKLKNNVWKPFNIQWLLPKIIEKDPTSFHKELANLYEAYDAINITLNFDGLLIREFEVRRKKEKENGKKNFFSLPVPKECEDFFLRLHDAEDTEDNIKEYLEIQIRGDILYVKCDLKTYCPNKGKEHSLWASIDSFSQENHGEEKRKPEDFLTCPYCGNIGFPFLSFPGSYEKEKDMKDMLAIVWKYLAFRVGSVTVVGTSGEWDPLIIAFLGDLLAERDIPLLVVDRYPKGKEVDKDEGKPKTTYIIRELVDTKTSDDAMVKVLGVTADQFMEDLTKKVLVEEPSTSSSVVEHNESDISDKYWDKEVGNNSSLEGSINLKLSRLENDVRKEMGTTGIDKFAQLGLKSYWMGTKDDESRIRNHTRFYHSVGVMKIASYLYERAVQNTIHVEENPAEKQFLRLAALLHDIGHLPFSHLIEDVFNELNWKPAGYKDHYSHIYQTDKAIEDLFNRSEQKLKKQLEETGYNVTDVIKLVNGSFGVGYLDAIINSSIDADKIDYVFRDTSSTERKTSLAPVQFLIDIVNGLSITPENYLSFSEVSAMAAVGLLMERQRLYGSLYLQPGIVVLEGIVKLIIKTYFVHSIKLDDSVIIGKMKLNDNDYPDLGEYKISYCVKKLQGIFDDLKENNKNDTAMYEMKIVKKMFEEIKIREDILGKNFSKNIKKGFDTVYSIKHSCPN